MRVLRRERIREAAAFGASALDASLPFDELALIAENVPYLQQKLQVQVEVCSAESAKPDHKARDGPENILKLRSCYAMALPHPQDAAGNSQQASRNLSFAIGSN